MDGVPAVLGPTSDMLFVGGRTRLREDQVQEERAAEVSISRLFNGSGSDHHVSGRRRSHNVDIRRDREEGEKHGGVGIVRRNNQGGRGRDKRDSMVVSSIGGTRARTIGESSGRFDRFVDILTVACMSRDVRTNRPRSVPRARAVSCCINRCRVPDRGCR
jgi:hypothetical protein